MSIPSAADFLLTVLRAAEGGQSTASLRARVAENLAGGTPGGDPWPAGAQAQLDDTLRQGMQTLAAMGLLLANDDGLWCLTEGGRAALSRGLPLETGAGATLEPRGDAGRPRRYRGGNRPRAVVQAERLRRAAEAMPQSPAAAMRHAEELSRAALAEVLLARLRQKPPAFLEAVLVRLLAAMGYGRAMRVEEVLPGCSGDGGIDGLLVADELGLDRTAVQAKRYDAGIGVGAGAVRDFYGALARAKARKSVLATTSHFSREARDTAAALPTPMVLIDGPQLARLMIRHEVGCRVVARHAVSELDEGFFAGDLLGAPMPCRDAQEGVERAA